MIRLVVTAAVIERDGQFLVTRRQDGVHLAGFWEFPGGKCHDGEALAVCMAREIHEELAVEAVVGDEILQASHQYDDRHVELHFLRCDILGPPLAALGQEMRWVSRAELTTLDFPPADTELIQLLTTHQR